MQKPVTRTLKTEATKEEADKVLQAIHVLTGLSLNDIGIMVEDYAARKGKLPTILACSMRGLEIYGLRVVLSSSNPCNKVM